MLFLSTSNISGCDLILTSTSVSYARKNNPIKKNLYNYVIRSIDVVHYYTNFQENTYNQPGRSVVLHFLRRI